MKLYRFLLIATATLGLAFFSTSCGPNAQSSAVLGGLIGAGTGAIIGNQSGEAASSDTAARSHWPPWQRPGTPQRRWSTREG